MSSINVPFRLINYREPGQASAAAQVGLEVAGNVVPLTALLHLPGTEALLNSARASELTPGIQGLLTDWPTNFAILSSLANAVEQGGETSSRHAISLTDIEVLAPTPRPTKMLFAGANYERHVKEVENWEEAKLKNFQGIDKSVTKPYAFLKLPYCIIGPFDPVIYPHPHRKLDWEGELALVIGKRGKCIPAQQAMEYVAGFTIVNDYSLRDLTMRPDWPGLASDWLGGKNFDTSAALGPYLVPKEFIPNYLDLRMTLRVNGEVKQNTSTQEMVFKPNEIIEWVSSIVTLEPGDIIATGSPPGAGFATGTYLDVGDVVEAEIEGLGRQRNEIVEGDRQLR